MESEILAGVPTELWIGGAWRTASDAGNFGVENPAPARTLKSVAKATVDECIAVVDAAMIAWARRTPRDRSEVLHRAHEFMLRNSDRVTQSGIGREGVREGIIEYLDAQYVSVGW